MSTARTMFEAWLQARGLSARAAARDTGLSKSSIADAASGVRPLTRRQVTVFCAVYDCRPNDLTDQRIDRGPGRRWDPREGVPANRELGIIQ